MIRLKNETDIKYIQKAIRIGEYILNRMPRYMKPGITPEQINKKIEFLIWINQSTPAFKGYHGFPSASCISVNKGIIHGIPNNIPFNKGDIVKIDLGINYKGYISDQARTYFVGGLPNCVEDFKLVYATKLALDRAITFAVAGNHLNCLSFQIERVAKEFGLGILKDFCGHGVGYEIHEEPKVYNKSGLGQNPLLKKGMVLAVEPMFVRGEGNYTRAQDGWTVEADGLGSTLKKQ